MREANVKRLPNHLKISIFSKYFFLSQNFLSTMFSFNFFRQISSRFRNFSYFYVVMWYKFWAFILKTRIIFRRHARVDERSINVDDLPESSFWSDEQSHEIDVMPEFNERSTYSFWLKNKGYESFAVHTISGNSYIGQQSGIAQLWNDYTAVWTNKIIRKRYASCGIYIPQYFRT